MIVMIYKVKLNLEWSMKYMSKYLVNNYDMIIFDCDGVLMNTNLLKCEAFGKAVEGYSEEIVNAFVENCKNTFGVSRYVKFKNFFSEFADESYDERKYNMYLNSYANICKEIYNFADITPGVIELLKELSDFNKYLFVASGSDEQELNEAFKSRGLSGFFKGIYGSPKSKLECVSLILNNHPHLKAVFIGDAISDLNTAKHYDMDFIYMSKYTVQSLEKDEICRGECTITINELSDLL
ncbi:HAD family hydrolase [Fredinandcohnia humi]